MPTTGEDKLVRLASLRAASAKSAQLSGEVAQACADAIDELLKAMLTETQVQTLIDNSVGSAISGGY